VGDDVDGLLARIEATPTRVLRGRIWSSVGLALEASIPGARVGERVRITRRGAPDLDAEVVGFTSERALLLPLGPLEGVGPGDAVEVVGRCLQVPCSTALLGRVLDGLGRPLDGGPPIEGEPWDVRRAPPPALSRARVERPVLTGIRALDGLATLGEGQRLGLFAGAGVGKSTLLGQIARQSDADVFVVCLVGERGREVREFVEDSLGPDGLRRGVVVCATSDAPAMVRLRSAETATAIAEWFRDRGERVLLLMDSVTRFARAAREVGLARGELPARRGYPPSVFAALPSLLERAGTAARGSITALYTVLVEGGDLDEPIADEVRGILDGHVVLDRELALRGRFPAIDPLVSLSRVMGAVTTSEHRALATRLRELLGRYEAKRDLVGLGAYRAGSDPALDEALERVDALEGFLRQGPNERASLEETLTRLRDALR